MKILVVLSLLGCACAQLVYPYAYPFYAPAYYGYQYHSQDELGQHSFGHEGGPNSRHENKRFDGVVTGNYHFVDANGQLKFVDYVSDPVHGFRVIGSNNLPVAPAAGAARSLGAPVQVGDSADVKAAKEEFFRIFNEAAAAAEAAPDTRR